MVRRPAPTRWEPCCVCKDTYPPTDLVHVAEVIPGRKRGWVCSFPAEFAKDGRISCAEKRKGRQS